MKATLKGILTVVTVVACLTGTAAADWAVGDPYKMHYPQLPDPNGMNVLATYPNVLADDFLCIETGYINDVHIWGSWLNDIFPTLPNAPSGPDPGLVSFDLSIHADIPANPDQDIFYSRPGELLWAHHFQPGESVVWQWWAEWEEPFYDPTSQETIGFDTHVIQYNFFMDDREAFWQEAGTIYWLDVTATPLDPGAYFGWKTSADNWNDDAVYWDIPPTGGPPQWAELFDPRTQLSLDMAFVITPEPATMVMLAMGAVALIRRRRRK